ncbi:MAG: hydrogenase maturation nickel metallochaperone HypA [candidate division Zixibacteria bacterium]|nr:hydrogenase maturation nickel metallochaperone HypA [candidate division Zixibacteria bacterium]
MHEFSLLEDLLNKIKQIASENNSKQVVGVKIRIGALAHISAAHFREHFEHASSGTVAEGAELEITTSEDQEDPNAQDILLESVELSE